MSWRPPFNSLKALIITLLAAMISILSACDSNDSAMGSSLATSGCVFVEEGFGPDGNAPITVDTVVFGLDVPWGIGFLSDNSFLVTERPGRIRLVENGSLIAEPVATIQVGEAGEGGLLGLAIDPDFDSNQHFYVYYTAAVGGGRDVNRVQRLKLSADRRSAEPDRMILDNVPAGAFHDGGRLRFGPDGKLYVGTGDGRNPQLAQNLASPAGKILRINRDGSIPGDNPFDDNSPVFMLGIRNTQGFDWLNASTMIVTDHGPSGELGRTGGDEVTVAGAGANLGWPGVWQCDEGENRVTPIVSWKEAVPPGGTAIYTGSSIAAWRGDLIIAALGARHLQHLSLDRENGAVRVASHEVYLRNQFGRLRDAIMGPDGHLYVTTSNCDGRGACGPARDRVLRIRGE